MNRMAMACGLAALACTSGVQAATSPATAVELCLVQLDFSAASSAFGAR